MRWFFYITSVNILWYPIFGLTAIIIILLLTRPSNTVDELQKQAYESQLSFLRAKEAAYIDQEARIIQAHKDALKSDSVKMATKDEQIRQAKDKVAISRVSIQPLFDSIPELRRFIQGQDSVILIQGQQVDTLKSALQFREKLFNDLVTSHDAERNISERIGKEQDNRIANLEKQVKKTKRGNRWLKAGMVAIGVGSFFLGSQL